MAWGLRLCASTPGGAGSIPGPGSLHAMQQKKDTGKKRDRRTKKRDNKGPGAMPEPRLVPTLGGSSWRTRQVAGLTPLWVPSVTHHGAGISSVYVTAS